MPFPYEIIAAVATLVLLLGIMIRSRVVTALGAGSILPAACIAFFSADLVLGSYQVISFMGFGAICLAGLTLEVTKRIWR